MAFRIEITATAHRDLDAILKWLVEQHAFDAGWQWFRGLQDAIASLNHFPNRCTLAPEDGWLGIGVRQLLYGNKPHVYRILFTVSSDTVYVVGVRHGRRLPLVRH